MNQLTILFALITILCTVGYVQNQQSSSSSLSEEKDDEESSSKEKDDEDFYRQKCVEALPDVAKEDMTVYMYEPYFCEYYCVGKTEDDSYVWDMLSKVDGTECLSFEDFDQKGFECLSGTCLRSVDITACKENMGNGTLSRLDVDECTLNCYPEEGDKIEALKKAGVQCQSKDHPYVKALCNENQICLPDREFVSDPDGSVADQPAAEKMCGITADNDEDIYMFPMNENDVCEFLCWFPNNGSYNILDFENGYSCGGEKKCAAGQCWLTEDIEKCKSALGENLNDMVAKECTMTCVGDTKKETFGLENGAICNKILNEWGSTKQGKCDDQGSCVVEEKSEEEEESEEEK